jgi:hypothetical protein
MAENRRTHANRAYGASTDGNFGHLSVTNRDRILPSSAGSRQPSIPGRKWPVHLLILCGYVALPLAILLPFANPSAGLAATGVVGIAVAFVALACLDRKEPHRLRLIILGGGGGLTFLYFVIKPWLGL